MGRPSSFTEELGDRICERIIEGESLTRICRDEDFPSKSTVLKWLADETYKNFSDQYARARDVQQDTLADLAREKAESATVDDWQVARLQIDTIKWHASKVAPKKYGDKLDMNLGGQANNPIQAAITVEFVNSKPNVSNE